MNTIGPNQAVGILSPGVQVPGQNTQENQTAGGPKHEEDSSVRNTLADAGVQLQVPKSLENQKFLDPDKMRELAARVSEAIKEVSAEPYLVGFTQDPDGESYLIEIRRMDGTLVTSFLPEKVLNLNGNLDDLSGMVIDRKT